ncbi:MAG: UDP-glucose 4-epimerase GalE [Pseudomonadota bacterium]|nr:UDP-glucose 4-epimerase GalE [Pseudomonadota bacterium]
MNILITGALGYVGSHIAVLLSENPNFDLFLIDNFENSSTDTLKKIKFLCKSKINFFEMDIRNSLTISDFIKSKNIKTIIHCAGLKSVKNSELRPDEYEEVNVTGTYKLLNSFINSNNKKDELNFIFSSSACVYGKPVYLPYDELHPTNPFNNYGHNKVSIENMLNKKVRQTDNLKVVSLRYFNPVGAHDSYLIGDRPSGYAENLMPIINEMAKKKLSKLEIYGNDYNTPDGTAVRDYVHILDIAQGHLSALKYLFNCKKKSYEVFNLGSGKGISVLELIDTFQRVNKVKIPYFFGKRRKGDLPEYFADISKAKKILNWSPKKNLDQMCLSSWKFENSF